MKKSNSFLPLFFPFLSIMFGACDPSPKENGETEEQDQSQIVLIVEDSLVWNFLKQRKVSLKYLNDDCMPEIIDFSVIDTVKVFSIKSERESVELLFTDNSQSRYSYFLSKGDSVQIGLDKQKPWLKSVNRNTTVYDDNLELLRNRDLHRSTYSKLQDFYFL